MAMKKGKVAVTKKALIQRINRVLRKEDEAVRKSRGWRDIQNFGEYYILETSRNLVLHKDVDIEDLSRTLEVIRSHEQMEDD